MEEFCVFLAQVGLTVAVVVVVIIVIAFIINLIDICLDYDNDIDSLNDEIKSLKDDVRYLIKKQNTDRKLIFKLSDEVEELRKMLKNEKNKKTL